MAKPSRSLAEQGVKQHVQSLCVYFCCFVMLIITTLVVVLSLCTMVALQWEPQIIAVAVMYLAGRLCKFDIQEWTSKQSSRRWWEQFVYDVPVDVLEGTRRCLTGYGI